MKKKYILIIIIAVIVLCISFVFYGYNKNKKNIQENNLPKQSSAENEEIIASENENKIEDIKEDLGYNNLDNQIYEIKKEYDGREVISIKPNIQYKVAVAGAIKNEKPEFSEVDKILEQAPKKNGIWVTKKSREKFLNILKEIAIAKYYIDEFGFLNQKIENNSNEIDEKIKKINSEKKICSIDIDSKTYLIDEVTGNIEEYPFEELDPELPYEAFETENAVLYVISPNTYGKVDYKYVFEEVFR